MALRYYRRGTHVRPVCLRTGKLILSCLSASLTFCPGIFFWNVSHAHSIQVFSCPLPWPHARQPPRQIPAPTAPPRSTASAPRPSFPHETPASPATARTTTKKIPRPPAATPPPSCNPRCSPDVPLFEPRYSS